MALAVALLGLPFAGRAQYTNGIYAEFNTSMGGYTCALYYASAPKAVANFIALANGQRSWLDLPSGLVKTNPFYNGTIYHRVIAGFMNQGGSPNGLGTDGPGYAFVDEFTPSLRHDAFGVLSMANSGKDSNGAQYFITVEPTPWLNDVHTIFGRLYGGSNVVYAINHVATGANDKPLTNVVLNALTIRRVGAAATAFDINTNGLPLVTNLNLKISKSNSNVSLTFSNRLYADSRLYTSSDLTSWTSSKLGIDLSGTPTNATTASASASRRFFRAAQIQYPASTFAPKTVYSRTLTLVFTNGTTGTLIVAFNATGTNGGGTYTYNGSPGSLYSYVWLQEPYNGKLLPVAFVELNLDLTVFLNFDTATAGGFTGKVYPSPYYYDPNNPDANPLAYAVAGSFSISP
ncbi:MAG: hypothetical protein EXS35_17595 [Pedosphaera sp.]|nr:hypothetical protein [Pedosphaera sp.]